MQKTKRPQAKFQIQDMLPIGMALVVFGIAISFGLDVLEDTQADFVTNTGGCNATVKTACNADYNATVDSITGVAKLPEKLPLVATVVVAAVVIGILVRYLFVRFN